MKSEDIGLLLLLFPYRETGSGLASGGAAVKVRARVTDHEVGRRRGFFYWPR